MKTKPFKALRPATEFARQLASVPYDVVDTEEARALADGNPVSFLHVSRPEIDLPPETGIYSDEVYRGAVKALARLKEDGILFTDNEPSYYLYRQRMGSHSQIGIVTCSSIYDYGLDAIKKHEKTRQDKEDDRTRHVLELRANTGPVFLTYRDSKEIDGIVNALTGTFAPIYDFTADDSISHTVWKVPADFSGRIEDLFEKIPVCYVADGHHRAKAAFRAGSEIASAGNGAEKGDCEWFLSVLFPASQLKILPYNRTVRDLNGYGTDAFLKEVSSRFSLSKADRAVPGGSGEVMMYLGGEWYSLSWPFFESDPVSVLDVSVLQNRLLGPVLGIDDPRTDKRISFIGGIRGTKELADRVDSGRDAVAFSMAPVTVDQMMAIADANAIMPPKSTWFEPKLRSGLLIHEI